MKKRKPGRPKHPRVSRAEILEYVNTNIGRLYVVREQVGQFGGYVEPTYKSMLQLRDLLTTGKRYPTI